MVNGVYVTGWTELDQLLTTWAQHGVFSVLIPFVLIFAVVFAILERSKVFGERPAINAIISIAIGLLSLQMDFVRRLFYAEFFTNFGTGLIVLLAMLILTGLFITTQEGIEQAYRVIGAIIAMIIFIIVLINSAKWTTAGRLFGGGTAIWASLAVLIFILAITIFTGNRPKEGKTE